MEIFLYKKTKVLSRVLGTKSKIQRIAFFFSWVLGLGIWDLGPFTPAVAQDTIYLLSGKVFPCRVLEINQKGIRCEVTRGKKNKKKEVYVEEFEVYTINYEEGKRAILYNPSTNEQYNYTVEEMGWFIAGEQDAMKGYRSPFALITGFAAGASGSMIGLSPFYAPLIPAVWCFVMGVTQIKIREKFVSDPSLLEKFPYMEGYRKTARNIKVLSAVKGGIAGLVLGYAAGLLFLR